MTNGAHLQMRMRAVHVRIDLSKMQSASDKSAATEMVTRRQVRELSPAGERSGSEGEGVALILQQDLNNGGAWGDHG